MRIHLTIFLCLSLLVIACSPFETQIPTTHTSIPDKIPSSTITIKPILTSTFTPSPSLTPTLGFQLPPECQNINPNISQEIYSAYDFESIPCEYLSISPDGTSIVFVTLAQVSVSEDSDGIRRVAKLFSISSSETFQIHEAKCAFLYPEWTSTGHLVISDVPYDVGCEYTAIYNPVQKGVLTILEGAVRNSYRDYWSEDKTAFFLITPKRFGPICSETLSGFDLSTERNFPVIEPTTPNTNLYVVIGEPIWISASKTLLATVRDGVCSTKDIQNCDYENSYIVEISLNGTSPEINVIFYDPELDYSLQKVNDGTVEFKSFPFKPITCRELTE